MIRFFLKGIPLVIALSPLFFNKVDAYCSRCVKIEEEREREQRDHPQPVGYYDDQIKSQSNNKTTQVKNASTDSKNSLSTDVYKERGATSGSDQTVQQPDD